MLSSPTGYLVIANLNDYPGRLASAAPSLTLDWVRRRKGGGVADAVAQEVRARFSSDPLAHLRGHWFPYAAHVVLLDALAERVSDAELKEMGRASADHVHEVLPGVSTMLRFISPKRLVKSAGLIWSTYADFGKARVLDASRRGGRVAITGINPTEPFCTTMGGFLQGLLERVGARDVAVEHTECIARGHDACVFEGRWS